MRLVVLILLLAAGLSARAKTDAYTPVTVADLETGKFDNMDVEFTGKIDDAMRDEIDHRFVFYAINDNGHTIFIADRDEAITDRELAASIGATVRVHGHCVHERPGSRRQFSRQIDRSDILLLEPAPKDIFSAPRIDALTNVVPAQLSRKGRHSAYGRVTAVWGGDHLLLNTDSGEPCVVQLRQVPPPAYGDFVMVVGLPETDFFRIHLAHALWRPAPVGPIDLPDVCGETDTRIVSSENGHPIYAAPLYGLPVRRRGVVRGLPTAENETLYLSDGDATVAIDTSSVPAATAGLRLGSTVEATGVCIFDVDIGRTGSVFPRIRGYRLVLRTPEDLRVLRQPPWWTAGKLLSVIALLLGGLVLAIVRAAVQRRVERLRLEDRTRLAIDLHDSVSQNLTSVLMQIDAARQLAQTDTSKTVRRLDIASKTVSSCRMELRNCIRDLRDNALDLAQLPLAIRKVLTPHLVDTALSIRFNVPRSLLSDNTTHAVLCMLRELVTNAVRHGRATRIRIAGTLEGRRLLFSVTDNGCGFDPDTRPGVSDGHFGLVGVAERVRALGGQLKIASTPGSGTRVSVSLPIDAIATPHGRVGVPPPTATASLS